MNEIYRTFEGKLNVETQKGFIVYTTDTNRIIIESLYVYSDRKDSKVMIEKTEKYNENTLTSYDSIMECLVDLIDCNKDYYEQRNGIWVAMTGSMTTKEFNKRR